MSEHRGFGLGESHLLPDAVVAFVDNELSLGAHERAAAHIARCPGCAADVHAQRQARAAVRRAQAPAMSPGFLASLRSIPEHTDLGTTPDHLAISADGQLVAVQRPDRVAGLRSAPLGSSAPLGQSGNVLGSGERLGSGRRRAAQGPGVVVSGLVLSALALVATAGGGTAEDGDHDRPGTPPAGVLRAQFGGTAAAPTPTSATIPTTTSPTPVSAQVSASAGVPVGDPR
ncbi:zf-HC2 domain-containing protein [Prauserella oleivorans]|uniref:Zf-HC2 domain-containing protein n=1 Tax=Prauserella oleivorans TaxID=1478153 RepID=A0ABW5WD65_9PSEU